LRQDMGQDIGLGKAFGANAQNLIVAPAGRTSKYKANCQQELFEMHETYRRVNVLVPVLHGEWPRDAAADLVNL
jgi:hypothetical protein